MTDNSPDEHLTEKDALAQAKADGIEFVDWFTVEGDEDTKYDTREEAEANADGAGIIQHRTQKQPEEGHTTAQAFQDDAKREEKES